MVGFRGSFKTGDLSTGHTVQSPLNLLRHRDKKKGLCKITTENDRYG